MFLAPLSVIPQSAYNQADVRGGNIFQGQYTRFQRAKKKGVKTDRRLSLEASASTALLYGALRSCDIVASTVTVSGYGSTCDVLIEICFDEIRKLDWAS